MHRPQIAAIVFFVLFCVQGCTEKARDDAIRALVKQATSFNVDRGFHVIDGQPVYLDSNASVGKIRREIPNVDAATFRILPPTPCGRMLYAADAHLVYFAMYYNVITLPHADAPSFQLLPNSNFYARDRDSVFYLGVTIEGADPATFTQLTDSFAKDKSRAYLGIKPIPVKDLATWTPLGEGLATDPWHRDRLNTHPRKASEVSGFGWSKDESTVYWGSKVVKGALASTFVVLDRSYAKDEMRVYYSGEPIANADAASFSLIQPSVGPEPDATDENRDYKYGKPQ